MAFRVRVDEKRLGIGDGEYHILLFIFTNSFLKRFMVFSLVLLICSGIPGLADFSSISLILAWISVYLVASCALMACCLPKSPNLAWICLSNMYAIAIVRMPPQ